MNEAIYSVARVEAAQTRELLEIASAAIEGAFHYVRRTSMFRVVSQISARVYAENLEEEDKERWFVAAR